MKRLAAGHTNFNYELSYTIDGCEWTSYIFDDLEEARDHADKVRKKHRDNKDFMFYARRFCVISTSDFIDRDVEPARLRIA